MKGSMTIEASYIMSAVLLALGMMISICLINHDRILATAFLNEAVELYGHQDTESRHADEGRLSYLLSEMPYGLSILEYRDGCSGSVTVGAFEAKLRDKGFKPQELMRRLTLIEVLKEK